MTTNPRHRPRTPPAVDTPTARQIHTYCDTTGATLKDIAEAIGVHPNTVKLWARGYSQPANLARRHLEALLGPDRS